MFGTPKAPISDGARDWMDEGMVRLVEMFGENRLREAPLVLATREFFPKEWATPEDGVEEMLERVCGLMSIPRQRVELVIEYKDESARPMIGIPVQSQDYAGQYRVDSETGVEKIVVSLGKHSDPVSIVSVLAHELCHVLLLGDEKIGREVVDGELLTDLLTVFLGFGVLTANAVFRMAHHESVHGQSHSMRRQGYLSEAELGYALALWTLRRGEAKPKWAQQLSRNPRAYFDQSLRYLQWSAKKA